MDQCARKEPNGPQKQAACCLRPPGREGAATMRYTTTDGPKKPLNAIQDGSFGGKMGIAGLTLPL